VVFKLLHADGQKDSSHGKAKRHILATSCCKQARITYCLFSISSLKIHNTILPSDMQTLIHQFQPLTDLLVVIPTAVLLTYRYSHTDCCITDKNCILYTSTSQLGVCKFSRFCSHVFSFMFFLILVLLSSLVGKLLFSVKKLLNRGNKGFYSLSTFLICKYSNFKLHQEIRLMGL
jgi:hypothetical protein